MPLPPAQPVRTTVPAAAAPTGVPHGAARSRPECSFQTLRMGWKRIPNRDVLRPWTGIANSVPPPGFTDGMATVGTLEGRVRTVVSSPGGSSGTGADDEAPATTWPVPAGADAPEPSRGISSPASREKLSRSGWAVLSEWGVGACATGAMGTAAESPGWVPSETSEPTMATENTAATSDLTP